jgi:hypothetical protein
MKLDVKAFSLAAGILWGAAVLLITLAAVWRGAGMHVGLLAGIYPGYQVSYLGSIAGLVYGFVTGAILAALLAWLYNKLGKQV